MTFFFKLYQLLKARFYQIIVSLLKKIFTIIFRYDSDNDGYLDVEDLKGMMMVRGVPWTHSAIVRLIRDADEDGDGKLSFREVSVVIFNVN